MRNDVLGTLGNMVPKAGYIHSLLAESLISEIKHIPDGYNPRDQNPCLV